MSVPPQNVVRLGAPSAILAHLLISRENFTFRMGHPEREGPPEYSGKMLGSSIQGIQAEYSVGSENIYFSKVDRNHFQKQVCRENVKKILKIKKTECSVE